MGAADMEITLVTENSKVRYVGDGARVEFTYDFNPIDLNYVKVYKNLVEVNSPDITVSPGVVTFEVAPLAGDTIVIMRDMPLTYAKGIVSKGIINSDSLDNLAVELLGQIQQVNEKLSRTPTYPLDTSLTGEEIFSEFNQNVQSVKDAKDIVNGKVEEVNSAVSSGLNEITEVTSESQTAITEEKNSAISEIQSTTEGIIQRAETAADEAEASAQAAATSASLAQIENKISNCIITIPDNIKLTLTDGTLTLKNGSKAYKFDNTVVNITKDLSISRTGSNGQKLVFTDGNGLAVFLINMCVSSDTNPGAGYQIWYNNNEKKIYADSTAQGNFSLYNVAAPIGIVTCQDTKAVSIDQVFNGFGFIGSHWYYLEGTSGRDMNGRNADGSLNSVLHTASNLGVFPAGDGTGKYYLFTDLRGSVRNSNDYVTFWQDDKPATTTGNYGVWISQRDNIIRYTNDKGVTWNPANWIYCGWYEVVDGKITKLEMKQPIKLPDEQDVVHNFGNETISGIKTFTGGSTNNTEIFLKNLFIDRDVNPSKVCYCSFLIRDKNLKQIANFYCSQNTDGSVTTHMIATGRDGKDSRISVRRTTNGTTITESPTPPVSDNSTQIATTNWFNQKIQVVSALPSSPNANVYYFIPE